MAFLTGYKSFKGEEFTMFITDLHRYFIILLMIIYLFFVSIDPDPLYVLKIGMKKNTMN